MRIVSGAVPTVICSLYQLGFRPFPVQVCVLSEGLEKTGFDGFLEAFALRFDFAGTGLAGSAISPSEKPNSAAALEAAFFASR